MNNVSSGTLMSSGVDTRRELKKQDPSSVDPGEEVTQKLGAMLDANLRVDYVIAESDAEACDGNLEDRKAARNLDADLGTSNAGVGRCLTKCATFPNSGYPSSNSVEGEDKNPDSLLPRNVSFSRSLSLPAPQKLVSAMKGSREKEGAPPKKLNVSWAPDVYDPPPTSVSHLPKKKTQQQFKNNKKHGKGKQKGKNLRNGGSSPKDKKLNRKAGGRPDGYSDSFADADLAIPRNSKSSVAPVDFDKNEEDASDSSCASSFLRKSYGTMHVAYAEAM